MWLSNNIFSTGDTIEPDQWGKGVISRTCPTEFTEGDPWPDVWKAGGPSTDGLAPITVTTSPSANRDAIKSDMGADKQLNADGTFSDARDVIDSDIIDDINDLTGPSTESEADEVSDYGGPITPAAGTPYTDTAGDGIADTWKTNNGLTPATDYTSSPTKADAYDIPFIEHFLNGTKIRWRHGANMAGVGRGINRGQVK